MQKIKDITKLNAIYNMFDVNRSTNIAKFDLTAPKSCVEIIIGSSDPQSATPPSSHGDPPPTHTHTQPPQNKI